MPRQKAKEKDLNISSDPVSVMISVPERCPVGNGIRSVAVAGLQPECGISIPGISSIRKRHDAIVLGDTRIIADAHISGGIALFIDDLHRGADSVLLDDIEALSVMIRDQGRSAIGFFYG